MIFVILIQRSEGGALGMGGGPSGFMSARGAGNLLTKATSILAFFFFANSIGLTLLSQVATHNKSVLDQVGASSLKLDPAQIKAQQETAVRQMQAARSSASSAAPSLTQLPMPSLTVAPSPTPSDSSADGVRKTAAHKPSSTTTEPNPVDTLKAIKIPDSHIQSPPVSKSNPTAASSEDKTSKP